jgi:hypothetical protein
LGGEIDQLAAVRGMQRHLVFLNTLRSRQVAQSSCASFKKERSSALEPPSSEGRRSCHRRNEPNADARDRTGAIPRRPVLPLGRRSFAFAPT